MDRFGMFVDAGYLYSASGKLLFGTTERRRLIMNFDGILGSLQRFGADNCRLEHRGRTGTTARGTLCLLRSTSRLPICRA